VELAILFWIWLFEIFIQQVLSELHRHVYRFI